MPGGIARLEVEHYEILTLIERPDARTEVVHTYSIEYIESSMAHIGVVIQL